MTIYSLHSVVSNSATPWTVHGVIQARIPTLGDLPDPGVKFRSPSLQADSLPSEPSGKPLNIWVKSQIENILSPVPSTDTLRRYTKMLWVVSSEWWDYRWSYVCPSPLLHAILTFICVLLCNVESQKIYLKDNRESAKSWHAVTEARGGEAWFWLCPLWLGDRFSTLSYWGQRPDPYIWQVVVLVDFEMVVWVQWWGQFWLASGFVYCRSLTQSCPTLCHRIDCSLPGSSDHGIFPERILEWVGISSSRGSSWLRDQTRVSCIGRWILYHWATWEALSLYIVCKK